jgi:hypothetical protein
MKRIYIAGKLSDMTTCGYIQNVSTMIKKANEIRKLGYAVFIPALDILTGIIDGGMEYTDYTDNNKAWLKVADAVFVLPGSEQSRGTQEEIALALMWGIPCVHKVQDVADLFKTGGK